MFWLFSLLRCDLEYTCFWLDYSELRSVNIFRRCCSMKLFICSKTPRPDSEWQASDQLAVAGFLNKKTPHPSKPRSATLSPPSTPRVGCLSSVLQLHTACTLLKHIWSWEPISIYSSSSMVESSYWQELFNLYVLQVSRGPQDHFCILLLSVPCVLQLVPVASAFQFDFTGSPARRWEEGRSGKSLARLPQDGCVTLCKSQVFYRILSSGFE